jgi:glycosyltransferase involved in cell wall biosynthesis
MKSDQMPDPEFASAHRRASDYVGSDRFQRSVSLITWGHNEEDSIDSFFDNAVALMEGAVQSFEIIFVDDASTDRTAELAKARAARDGRIRFLQNERNMDVGMNARRAISSVGSDYFFWQTVDWSYDLGQLRLFLELLKHYDVVQCVRPVAHWPAKGFSLLELFRSYRSRSDTATKAIVSMGNYLLIRCLYGVRFHDYQNVTIYPTKLVHALQIRGRSAFVNPELLLKAWAGKHTFIEVPIRFIARTVGTAKGTRVKAVLSAVRDVFVNWLRWGWRIRLLSFSLEPPHSFYDLQRIRPEARPLVEEAIRRYGENRA